MLMFTKLATKEDKKAVLSDRSRAAMACLALVAILILRYVKCTKSLSSVLKSCGSSICDHETDDYMSFGGRLDRQVLLVTLLSSSIPRPTMGQLGLL